MQQLNILDEIQDNQVLENFQELDFDNIGWKIYTFSDFVKINPTISLKKDNLYSFVEMKDLSADQKYVSPSIDKEFTAGSRFENRDTLFARITPCLENGKICQVKNLTNGIGFGSTEFIVLRGKEGISDTDFIYYLSRTPSVRSFAEKHMVGTSGRQRVNKEAFNNLKMLLPSLKEQEKIAKILSSLDDKIELNQKMNKTLEEMAQAIFKHWFIDFEFPNDEGKPYKSSGGEMIDSELGEIPLGWKYGNLDELANVKGGKRLPLGSNLTKNPNKHPYIRVRDMGNKYIINSNLEYVPEDVFPKISNYIVSKGDLIVSIVGTVGLISIISSDLDNASLTENCVKIVVRDKNDTSTNYLYYYLTSDSGISQIKSKTVGSTQPKLPIYNIKDINLVIPDKNVQSKFEKILSQIGNKVELNELNNKLLISLRDSLLPKLMSGEINPSPSSLLSAFKGSKEGEQEI